MPRAPERLAAVPVDGKRPKLLDSSKAVREAVVVSSAVEAGANAVDRVYDATPARSCPACVSDKFSWPRHGSFLPPKTILEKSGGLAGM